MLIEMKLKLSHVWFNKEVDKIVWHLLIELEICIFF